MNPHSESHPVSTSDSLNPEAVSLAARLRHGAEALPFIVWTATPDGQVDFANHHLHDVTGVDPDADPATRWQGLLHPDDLSDCLELWEKCVRTEEPYDIVYRIYSKAEDAYRWHRVHAAPVRDGNGAIALWYGVALDIHETKQLQTETQRTLQELAHNEYMLRMAMRLNRMGAWWVDLQPEWKLNWSPEMFDILDFPAGDTPGVDQALSRYMPRDQAIVKEAFKACSEEGTPFELTMRVHIPGSTCRWTRTTGEAVRDEEGRIFRIEGSLQDVTRQKESEEKLQEQASLLDEARDAIIVQDADRHILYWNHSAERLYGWSAGEAVGQCVEKLLFNDPQPFQEAMRELLESEEWHGELTQVNKEGQEISVEARWTLIRDEEREPKSVFSVNTDVTERKKLEQQFLRSQRMESIGTLAGGIAHDLNNLLAPIVMGVDLLQQHDPDPRLEPIIENIGRSARRGSDLVKQVLSFARGVEGARVTVDVPALLGEIQGIMGNTFPKNIRVDMDFPEGIWPVVGDVTQLNQVFLNICVNARDAMPDGGELRIKARNVDLDEQYAVMDRAAAAGRYVQVQIADTGSGMSKEVRERIFEPFFSTKETGKGTGLGLSTGIGIIRSHGGFVNVYSEPGKGSVFKIYLPAQDESEIQTHETDTGTATLPRGHGEHVLVVDDEISILTITKQTLEAFGYKVLTAEDGAQAMSVYAMNRDKVDVVLTDMMMPVMDGAALISALKRLTPDLPVIASSGLRANGGVVRATAAGATDFLHKPYTADTILRALERALRSERASST